MARRFERRQIDELKLAFDESKHLTKKKKIELCRITGLDVEQVTGWFNRMRARKRSRETMEDLKEINVELKKLVKDCRERAAELEKAVAESREREAVVHAENQELKRRMATATATAMGKGGGVKIWKYKDHVKEYVEMSPCRGNSYTAALCHLV
ncbi:homeobox-leucine zipper protein ATHB-7-like [Andrographis paniculata]|uniref:homeobox-leucine zipper protein ATHB-7-like n=1 Tax=Andrographis paniculata TaxID=175694 RepID=UPI0021E88C2D|nr:homeobox-leucine zipper protein ATHB-7-like [Andrographis paniculata]XP_051133350.1 homeobox-leucine zipper protein ATHB-7-like [Andrographis paniculata]